MKSSYEEIAEEFLQASSHLRLGIILNLQEKTDNLSSLAKKLDATASEMHRNLKRLVDDNIISKNSDGDYTLTAYGQMICTQIDSWEFMKQNSSYFEKHGFGNLPRFFIQSLGSLNNSKHIKGFVNIQEIWKKIYSDTGEYVNNVLFEVSYDKEILSIITSQLKKGIVICSIFLEDAILPDSRENAIKNKDITKAIQDQILVRRTIKDINTLVVLNETEALVMFPKPDGEIDVSEGFYSDDPLFHNWCKEYFEHCLNSSSSFFEEKFKQL